MLSFNEDNIKHSFEISLVLRDHMGKPTGKRKEFATDDANKLHEFFQRFQGKPKKRRKKQEKKTRYGGKAQSRRLPSEDQAKKIMKKMYNAKDELQGN